MSEPVKELRPIEFKFGKPIEWEEWRTICIPRLQYAQTLKIPHLPQLEPHDGICAIVGAAPGVEKHKKALKAIRKGEFNIIMSLNASHKWLCNVGLAPDIHVLAEHDLEDAITSLGCSPNRKTTYYVASFSDQRVFDDLKGFKRVLWHKYLWPQGYQQYIAKIFPNEFMVTGGDVGFFKSISIATILGYRHFEIFGCTSSFEGENDHMKDYKIANTEERVFVWGKNERNGNMKKFKTTPGLAFQAYEFLKFCKHNQAGLKIRVHDMGLLRYVHEACYPEQYISS